MNIMYFLEAWVIYGETWNMNIEGKTLYRQNVRISFGTGGNWAQRKINMSKYNDLNTFLYSHTLHPAIV